MADKEKSGGIYDLWKNNVPVHARMYLQTLFGDRNKPFTEKDFTPAELRTMESTINNATARLIDNAEVHRDSEKRYLDMLDVYRTGADRLIKATKNDKDWAEYRRLDKKYGALDWDKTPKEVSDKMWDLRGTLLDRYGHLGPGKTLWPILGETNPEVIRQHYKDRLENYAGNGQEQEVLNKVAEAELHKKQALAGSGNVQYDDYAAVKDAMKMNPTMDTSKEPRLHDPRDYLPDALGRFTYETTPTGQRQISDKYDFYNEVRAPFVDAYNKASPMEKIGMAAKTLGPDILNLDPQGFASDLGNIAIGKNGRPVQIKYDPKAPGKKKGGKIAMPDGYKKGGNSSLI